MPKTWKDEVKEKEKKEQADLIDKEIIPKEVKEAKKIKKEIEKAKKAKKVEEEIDPEEVKEANGIIKEIEEVIMAEEESTEKEESSDEFTDSEKNRMIYKKETGGRPILRGNLTSTYLAWLKRRHIEEEDIKEAIEEVKKANDKKPKVRSWKDEIEIKVDVNLKKTIQDLRKDLRDFIISLKSEKIELENKLKDVINRGFITILYGRPGIGKSVFCASGVLDNFTVVFLDLTNQGRRLKQFPKISESEKLIYEQFHEKREDGSFDASKSFEKLDIYLLHVIYSYDPKSTIIVLDGFSEVIHDLNSYLRQDILKVGEPKRGRQEDIGYGDWYWRNLRYRRLLKNLESGADRGFRIFLTCEVINVVDIQNIGGKMVIKTTRIRAPKARDEDLYAADIEAFFRPMYDIKTDIEGDREIEIKVSKVPGIIEGTVLEKPKMIDFINLQDADTPKDLDFGE